MPHPNLPPLFFFALASAPARLLGLDRNGIDKSQQSLIFMGTVVFPPHRAAPQNTTVPIAQREMAAPYRASGSRTAPNQPQGLDRKAIVTGKDIRS
jgi:hypothetical protein